MSVATVTISLIALCNTPANAALAGNWRLDEASGPAVSDVSTTLNGALVGPPVQDQAGRIGTAYTFGGGSSVKPGGGVAVPPAPSPVGTISAWVNPTEGAWTGNIAFWQNPTYIQFRLESNNALVYRQDGGHDRRVRGGIVPDGVWSHVVAVVDASSIKLYINGALSTSAGGSNGYVSSATTFMQIGAGAGNNFEGSIDDVAVWDVALSDGQVGTLGSILEVNGAALNDYNAFLMDKLFTAYETGTPQSVDSNAGTLTWSKFTDGSGTAGSVTYDEPTQTYRAYFDGTSGVMTSASEASAPLLLSVTQNGANLNFTWNSQPGKVYDLLSATALTTAPASWEVWNGNADLTGSSLIIPLPGDPQRFFALREKDAP
ncbi:MAG: LamG domain-containing protein [Verrucomicrobia bacterium]|nr:LamG domain-containing protein [Verrucomicrobiota bacterium]MDA1005457.1 LamG domain-containing protein [Verrucomicrobiota bacterium]